jgi:uncharacterized protein VirK/YbjX
METKQAKVIIAETDKVNEVKLYIQDNGFRDYPTIKDLMETLEEDKKWHEEHGQLEQFLNTPITMQLTDIEGQEVEGKMCLDVGMLTNNIFVLTGNIDNISFVKED